MFKADVHELLCLFAVMVIADKKVYSVEVDSFVATTIDFFTKTNVEPAPSEARLYMWFEINRENIKSRLTQNDFENWFESLMKRVAQTYPESAIVSAIECIANSDNEVHISEKALLVLVARYWQTAA